MASIFQWFDFELESLKGVIRLDRVWIDNYIFRMHYKLTVPMLIILSAVQACREYLGDPIDCVQGDDVPGDMLDTYCWIHSTFTLPGSLNKEVGVDVPHPGVDISTSQEDKMYHTYYQWVCFVLFIESLLFYAPRYLWRMWEGGLMTFLVQDLNKPIAKAEDKEEKLRSLVKYMKSHHSQHKSYFAKYLLAEIFNFVTAISQMYLIDDFLGGTFSTYGPDVINFTDADDEEGIDPMRKVFPRMTKCTFHRFGSSGDIVKYDALCILPLNVFNEKIFVFLWFYYVFVAVLTGLVLLYRVLLITIPSSRSWVFQLVCTHVDSNSMNTVVCYSNMGDWHVLNLLRKNLDSVNFCNLIDEMANDISQISVHNGRNNAPNTIGVY